MAMLESCLQNEDLQKDELYSLHWMATSIMVL